MDVGYNMKNMTIASITANSQSRSFCFGGTTSIERPFQLIYKLVTNDNL
ncbi:protein of unknown function [Moritella yayanosii]|uniref:Uncharacterized protein n=1 Tax=Moritella yayanosii TaxID=69539 RepID=A0A330LW09_9GAMM|nr:protein of unknown function [Moritella yayanosii]